MIDLRAIADAGAGDAALRADQAADRRHGGRRRAGRSRPIRGTCCRSSLNLVANAEQALAGRPAATLRLRVRADGDRVVADGHRQRPGARSGRGAAAVSAGDAAGRSVDGLGIGLAVSKWLTEQQGGTLTYARAADGGSVSTSRCLAGRTAPVGARRYEPLAPDGRRRVVRVGRRRCSAPPSRCSLSMSVVRLRFSRRAACRLLPPVFSRHRRISSRSSCDIDRREVDALRRGSSPARSSAAWPGVRIVLGQHRRADLRVARRSSRRRARWRFRAGGCCRATA